eukprot:11218496-Alexandrium_andersonii.AAC.1
MVDRYGGRWDSRRVKERKDPFRKRPSEVSTEVWEAFTRTQQHDWWNAENSGAPAPCAVAGSSCHFNDGEDDRASMADPDTD